MATNMNKVSGVNFSKTRANRKLRVHVVTPSMNAELLPAPQYRDAIQSISKQYTTGLNAECLPRSPRALTHHATQTELITSTTSTQTTKDAGTMMECHYPRFQCRYKRGCGDRSVNSDIATSCNNCRQSNDIDSYGWEGTIPDLSHIVPPIPPPPPPPASFVHPWATAELQAPHFPQTLLGSNYHDPSVHSVRRCNCCPQSAGMPAPPQPVTAVPSSPPLKRFLHPYLSPPKPLIPPVTTLSPPIPFLPPPPSPPYCQRFERTCRLRYKEYENDDADGIEQECENSSKRVGRSEATNRDQSSSAHTTDDQRQLIHLALDEFLEKLNIDCSKSSNAGADMRKQSQAPKDIEQEVENDLKISSDSLEVEKID